MRALPFLALTALAIAGCAADANSNTHQTACTDANAAMVCGAGESCHRGFCVGGGMDSGPGPDTGVDSGPPAPDTGVDGGPDTGIDANRDAYVPIDANTDADNHCDGGGAACTTGQVGLCNNGHRSCGSMTCVRNADPIAELCNSNDDDCDGLVDEETDALCYPPAPTVGCTRNADGTYACVGTCRPGTSVCTGGSPGSCSMDVTPNTEGCQAATAVGLDDDCDGMVDEFAADSMCTCTPAAMRQCFNGLQAQAGVGRCLLGSQTCDASGHWGTCMGSGMPMPETCANHGTDDDCDGTVDNVPGIGAPCTIASAMGVCADGVTACMSNAVMCTAPASSPELCNHLDDDCDGSTDEGIDTMTDGTNCGMCGHACGAGTSCCNGSCVDESSDHANCMGCGMTCPSTANTCCSSSCADTMTDAHNCGMCGHACAGGQTCCGGSCVDTTTDPNNCTACGVGCHGTGMSCCGTCVASTAPACTGCPFDCTTLGAGGMCCGTQCVDTSNDESHCGGCGTVCSGTQVCCNGHCVADDAAHCGGACTACGTGQLCCSDRCVGGGDSLNCHMCGRACTTGQSCCTDGCHNFQTDNANCGNCGQACTAGTQHCTSGHCCATGLTYCGSSCVNTQTDGNNCGSCGHPCSALYGCVSGSCVFLGL